MLKVLILVVVLVSSASGQDETFPPDMSMSDLASYWGYEMETHQVITRDGYILEIHRLPRTYEESNTGIPAASDKPAVYVQHGLASGSSRYLMGPPQSNIGYVLADAGFDVWLGNTRGNTYSRAHTSLNPDTDVDFWKYDFEAAGRGDVTAVIDHVLSVTGRDQLFYVGTSMGSTEFLVAMAEEQEYQDKVQAAFLQCPVAFMDYVTGFLDQLAQHWEGVEDLFERLGIWEMSSDKEWFSTLGHDYCDEDDFPQNEELCLNLADFYFGLSEGQLNVTMLPWMFDYKGEGTSSKVLVHYGQVVDSGGHFLKYDYGDDALNIAAYGTATPPDYDLGSINVPVHIYWGDADVLATPQDVARLQSELPDVRHYYQVPLSGWTHNDFSLAIDARALVYDVIVSDMQGFAN